MHEYSSVWSAFKEIGRTEGVGAFWNGFRPTVLRDIAFCGVFIMAYEGLKLKLPDCETGDCFEKRMAAGLFAGVIATVVSQPLDMARNRMQMKPDEYKHVVQTIQKIIKEERVKKLFPGLIPRIGTAGLGSAVAWALYEGLVSYVKVNKL